MKLLFVEDDAMNRRVVKDMLNVAGVDMDEAGDMPFAAAEVKFHGVVAGR